jgi:anti-sigma regulatory factor (Ser/Thr protein kinase)
MADTARAPARGLLLLSAALRRLAVVFGLRGRLRGGGPDPVERFDITLPAHPSSLFAIRRALRRLSRDAGLDEDRIFALQVAVGEALNNVIEHAYRESDGALRVRARRDGDAVVVEVSDSGRWGSDRPDGAQRGRGILLMQGLADSVDIRKAPEGTTVRLVVSAEGQGPRLVPLIAGMEEGSLLHPPYTDGAPGD